MSNSHQTDHEDLKQDKDLGVVHRQEQSLSPPDSMEDSLAGLMLPQILPHHTPGTPVSVPWGPQCLETIGELLIQHSQRIWNYPELRVGLAVYCRLPSQWQMWHPISASRPHKYNRKKQTRSLSQPGNTLNWEVITHELSQSRLMLLHTLPYLSSWCTATLDFPVIQHTHL